MQFPHFCLTALLALSLSGCRSVVSAQDSPNGKPTESPTKEPATATSLAGASNGLAISIACINSSTDDSGRKSQQPGILTYFSPDDPHINVVLRNTSAQPISIYQEWNSWGYFNLSLEISKINGKTLPKPIIVQKEGGNWFKNFPEAQTIAPGESIVREVHLPPLTATKSKTPVRSGYYLHFPLNSSAPDVYTMRAIFQGSSGAIPQDPSNIIQLPPVWKGTVASPPLNYVFR